MTIAEIATIISIAVGIATLISFIYKLSKIWSAQNVIMERLLERTKAQEKDIEENKVAIKENQKQLIKDGKQLVNHEGRICNLETKQTKSQSTTTAH